MVDRQRSRYVGGAEGAPPLPPPGGYHGARRTTAGLDAEAGLSSASGDVTYTATEPAEKRTVNALGLAAIIAAVLFALVMLLMMGAGVTDAVYGASMMVVQFVVLGVVIAALFTARGRVLGAIALAVTLVFNVATVGAMGALRSAATHAYDGTKSEQQKHEEAYPGIKGVPAKDALDGPSLEDVQSQGDQVMAAVRKRLTQEFGFTWVHTGAVDVSPERNGYGGESMLQKYTSTVWTTEQPVHELRRKRQVMRVIDQVLVESGLSELYPLNEPGVLGISDDMLDKLYGSDDPARQHTWEYYSDTYPEPLRFYAYVYDLSNDPTGEFRTQREAFSDQSGEPLEGVQLVVFARQVLPEKDRAAYEQKLKDYPGF
ncbi:hypothetical protein Q9R19_08875 [Microbacterium sp. ARD32]|uniref:hypothetical protein n=1 Tax=Microbacterium sp. ARD32 TaxID=2962577 RepID=UPI002882C8CF|nr:hypothetical protein [Microbacterium sp. ARD32]MDT0157735.1 hypothetical protein [Microbacterium sp. ARD32]